MVTRSARNHAYLSQRSIYDERYKAGRYDLRSAVPVLRAEREALRVALDRAIRSNPEAARVSLFDFGYGTGRVTNELITGYADECTAAKDLRVVAYDVSSVGLMKAQEALCRAGFASEEPFAWIPDSTSGYIAGSVCKDEANLTVTVVFVHAFEDESPEVMSQLALKANNGDPYLLTTSWYSGLGHIPGEKLRREYFYRLGELTAWEGEIVLAVSATGDLIELQPEWSEKLASGAIGDFPVEMPGDVVYDTELGQPNFYHVFGAELNDYMSAIIRDGQHWWVEGIRYPGEEFESEDAEKANYELVCKANEAKRVGNRVQEWDENDYREFHTVAARRSPMEPYEQLAAWPESSL
jgi:hypothetical protein